VLELLGVVHPNFGFDRQEAEVVEELAFFADPDRCPAAGFQRGSSTRGPAFQCCPPSFDRISRPSGETR